MDQQQQKPKPSLPSWASADELYRFQVRESIKHAVFALDTEGNLLSWNRGVEAILGYREDEWVGNHASIIFTPAEVARAVCESEMDFAARNECSSDIRWHVRKDGSELFAHGYMTALRLDDGTLVGYTKILSDETRTKQLQDSLTESNRALEQFAHIASHDLQEPLRTMSTSAELLARRLADQLDDSSRALVDRIRGGASRMTKLIEDLLAYARVETQEDRARSVSLAQDLETALTELEASIEETEAVITHDTLPTLDTDQGQMVRLFQNLVGNALKYHKPGVPPVVHISAEQQDAFWQIAVEDKGIGFDSRHAREIFQPFKRLHSQHEFPGSGVGLSICRRIVEAHGGRIWAKSEPGEGTCIYFTLPVAKPNDR